MSGFPRRLMSNIQARLQVQTPGIPEAGKYLLLDDSGVLGGFIGPFKTFFLDPANGDDDNDGLSLAGAKATLASAYALLTAGQNDVLILVGDGGTTATARVDASFTWAKNATHLVGICSPVLFSQRARIAPTGTTTAFTPFFTISGSGCIFQNIQWFHGFNTGTTAQINLVVTGSRNHFGNCHIAGMGDAASAADVGSRSLKIGSAGSGENVFQDCVIGLDTVSRGTAANASVELAGATPRNVFRNCYFCAWGTAATILTVIGTGTGCIDRFTFFDNCLWTTFGTTQTAVATLPASAGGFLFFKDCNLAKVTGFGSDATTRAQEWIGGAVSVAATSGITVNPTA